MSKINLNIRLFRAKVRKILLSDDRNTYLQMSGFCEKALADSDRGTVAEILLEEIFALKQRGIVKQNSYGVFLAVDLLDEHIAPVDPIFAVKVAEMLLWEEVLQKTDRSTRGHLMNILAKSGYRLPKVKAAMEEFVKRIPEIPYGDDFRTDELRKLDELDAQNVLSAIA